MTTLASRPLTADECTILTVVADAAVADAAADRGLPKMAARAAWHRLVESGALVPADDGDGAFAPHPRPYIVAAWAAVAAPLPRVPGRPGAAEGDYETALPLPWSGYCCPNCLGMLDRAPAAGADGRCPDCRAAVLRGPAEARARRRAARGRASGTVDSGWLA